MPSLNIIDKPDLQMYYCRYYDPVSRKQTKIGCRYGKRMTKDQAFTKIRERKENLIRGWAVGERTLPHALTPSPQHEAERSLLTPRG